MTTATTILSGPARPLTGVLLAATATLMFAIADVGMKHMMMLYAVPIVAAVRYVVSLTVLTAVMAPRHGRRLWHTQRTGLVLLRGFTLAGSSFTLGLALQVMPVGEAIAIMYLAPFIVMLLAPRLLGERGRAVAWIGAVAGFTGVLIIARPGGGLDPFGVTMGFATAALAAAYQLLSRELARTETTAAMMFHSMLAGVVFFGPLALFTHRGPLPDLADLGFITVLGLAALVGHSLLTAAYRDASASLLAPVNYLHLFWAGRLGWIAFGHVPDGWSMVGMALVGGAGIAVALHAHFGKA